MARQTEKALSEEQRREVFLALVQAQDAVGVARSRKAIAVRQ